jgi:hypothetical protein
MRIVYLVAPVVALVLIVDLFLNDPWPGQWGGLVWVLAKLGKLMLAALMLVGSVRHWRGTTERPPATGG